MGADAKVIANSMTGTFEYEKGDKREVPDFNVFFRYNATYPYYSDAVWYLTQMRRWGQICEPSPIAGTSTCETGVPAGDLPRAADELIAEAKLGRRISRPAEYGFRAPATRHFIDGLSYDGQAQRLLSNSRLA